MNSIWLCEMKEICAVHIKKLCGYRVTVVSLQCLHLQCRCSSLSNTPINVLQNTSRFKDLFIYMTQVGCLDDLFDDWL